MFLLIPAYLFVAGAGAAVLFGKAGGWVVTGIGMGMRLLYADKYPRGEGPTTPKWNGRGVLVSDEADDPLGKHLANLCQMVPELLAFWGRRYLLTQSEGEFLATILESTARAEKLYVEAAEACADIARAAQDGIGEGMEEQFVLLENERLVRLWVISGQVGIVMKWFNKLDDSRWIQEEKQAA